MDVFHTWSIGAGVAPVDVRIVDQPARGQMTCRRLRAVRMCGKADSSEYLKRSLNQAAIFPTSIRRRSRLLGGQPGGATAVACACARRACRIAWSACLLRSI